MTELVMYTDGACRGNPGPGGWGVVLRAKGKQKEYHGGEAATTNNRMELMAAIKGLEALRRPCKLKIYTDSVYVKNGITQWLDNWKRRGWRTASRSPVKNRDLWERLDALASTHDVSWHWVKGHAGDPGNERADELANQGVDELGRR